VRNSENRTWSNLSTGRESPLRDAADVQERRRARDSLRRTYQISRPYWRLVILLVVIPLGLEHALANTVRDFVDQWGNVAIVAGEWFIAATMLGIIGVIDVALANELMARVPAITTAAEAG